MTLEEFDALFDTFQVSAFHLETHQTYVVSEEDERLRAFREGLPRPERSVRTSSWLRRIALTTAAGKQWSRVHLIREPLSEYLRYQLIGYVESQAVGEEIRLASLDNHSELAELGPDSWLFDAGTPGASGVGLRFDPSGNLLGIEAVEQAAVSEFERQREIAPTCSLSLARYLISHRVAVSAMGLGKEPGIAQRLLVRELVHLRSVARPDAREIAKALDLSQATVSRVERLGQLRPVSIIDPNVVAMTQCVASELGVQS